MASSSPIIDSRSIAMVLIGTIAGFFISRIINTTPPPTILGSTKEDSDNKATDLAPPASQQKVPTQEPDDDSDDGEYADFVGYDEECKLVLVVRTDLGMTKGKIAAQASHATLACYKALQKASTKSRSSKTKKNSTLHRWEHYGQAKIAVQVKSEEELLVLQAQAISLGLCAKIIHDAGRTQIASGSATCLGVGPGPRSVVDKVTGGLKLL